MFGGQDDNNNGANPADNNQPMTDGNPAPDPMAQPAGDGGMPNPPADQPQPVDQPAPAEDNGVTTSAPAAADSNNDELLDIKQQALQQLSPLVGHLDQTSEERFRTTMMLIQASDNKALLKDAYDAAMAIPDERTRAQALLDVVNEINYFTQPQG